MAHGKLTKVLKIDKNLNDKIAEKESMLWFEDDGKKFKYYKDKRVGIAYASLKDQNRLWRYILKNS